MLGYASYQPCLFGPTRMWYVVLKLLITYIQHTCFGQRPSNKHVLFCVLQTPDVAVTLPSGGLKLYQPATIHVSFTNPLRTMLTGGKFVLHGEGFVQGATMEIPLVKFNMFLSNNNIIL